MTPPEPEIPAVPVPSESREPSHLAIETVAEITHTSRHLIVVYCRHGLIHPVANPDESGWLFDEEAATRAMLDDGRMWKLQLDTYEREVERYGGSVIGFAGDSITCWFAQNDERGTMNGDESNRNTRSSFIVHPSSLFRFLRRLLLKDNDVLPRQRVERLDPAQRVRCHLLEDLRLAHLVDLLDRHLRVLGPVFDEHESATRL
jgi:hypothetical protein